MPPFKWNLVTVTSIFFEIPDDQHVTSSLHTLQSWNIEHGWENNSVLGKTQIFVVHDGTAWTQVLEIADIIDKACGMETVQTYQTNIYRAHLERVPVFCLKKGMACFIPFGHIPIVVGVDGAAANADSTVSYSISPILEHKLLAEVSELVQSEVKAYLFKSIAKKLKIFRDTENSKSFKKWLEWEIGGAPGANAVDSDSSEAKKSAREKRSAVKRAAAVAKDANTQDGG